MVQEARANMLNKINNMLMDLLDKMGRSTTGVRVQQNTNWQQDYTRRVLCRDRVQNMNLLVQRFNEKLPTNLKMDIERARNGPPPRNGPSTPQSLLTNLLAEPSFLEMFGCLGNKIASRTDILHEIRGDLSTFTMIAALTDYFLEKKPKDLVDRVSIATALQYLRDNEHLGLHQLLNATKTLKNTKAKLNGTNGGTNATLKNTNRSAKLNATRQNGTSR